MRPRIHWRESVIHYTTTLACNIIRKSYVSTISTTFMRVFVTVNFCYFFLLRPSCNTSVIVSNSTCFGNKLLNFPGTLEFCRHKASIRIYIRLKSNMSIFLTRTSYVHAWTFRDYLSPWPWFYEPPGALNAHV